LIPTAFPFLLFPIPLAVLAKDGLCAERAEDVDVEVEATGVVGEEEGESGEDDFSRSMNDADSRSLEGTFDCDVDGVDWCV
jgi:hypothetical protein